MRGWPVHRPTHPPQQSSKQTATAPPTKNLTPSCRPLLRRQARNPNPLVPSSPEAARSPEPCAIIPLWRAKTSPSVVSVVPKLRLGMRPAKLCFAFPLNRPQNKLQRRPAPPVSFPSSAWECVPRSSASLSPSRNRPQNKRQQHPNHRHSGIFRRGASRDGKYPESPPQGGLAFPSEFRGNSSHAMERQHEKVGE